MSWTMPPPGGILDQAVSIVTQKILSLDNMAVRYSSQLSSALADIAGVQVPSVPAPSRLSPPDAIPPSVPLGAMPTFSAPPMNIPEIPGELNIDYLLADLDIGEMDAIPAAPAMIAVNIPEALRLAPNLQVGQINAGPKLPRHTRGQCGGIGRASHVGCGCDVEWAFVQHPLC